MKHKLEGLTGFFEEEMIDIDQREVKIGCSKTCSTWPKKLNGIQIEFSLHKRIFFFNNINHRIIHFEIFQALPSICMDFKIDII